MLICDIVTEWWTLLQDGGWLNIWFSTSHHKQWRYDGILYLALNGNISHRLCSAIGALPRWRSSAASWPPQPGFLFTPEMREETWPPTPDPPMSNTLNIAPSYGQFTLVSGRDGLILRWLDVKMAWYWDGLMLRWLDVKMAWCWVRWLAPRWHWWLARPGIPFIWAARAEKVRSVRSEHF